MKRRNGFRKAGLMAVALVMGLTLTLAPAFADFAGWGATYHVGKYYFKCWHGDETGKVYVSRHYNRGFKKTPVDDQYFRTDGEKIYYIDRKGTGFKLKTYEIDTKKVKTVARLPKADGWEIHAQAGKYLWVMKNWSHLYRYNMKAKSLRLVKKNADLWHLNGSSYLYQYGEKEYKEVDHDGSPVQLTCCKAVICEPTKKGNLRVKKSLGTTYSISDEMYSVVEWGKTKSFCYAAKGAHKVYRIKSNGTGKKLIKSFDGYVTSVYDTYCYVLQDDGYYRYTYKTGTMRSAEGE